MLSGIKRTLQVLVGPAVAAAILAYAWKGALAEDAYITLRYAIHLAAGHGLVWNIGERPVEGCTSPFHVALMAIVIRLGVEPEASAKLVGALSVLATVTLLSLYLPKLGAGPWVSAAAATAVACAPVTTIAVLGFDAPLAVLFSTVIALAFHRLVLDETQTDSGCPRGRRSAALVALPLGALFLCLARPDGAFLALPTLVIAFSSRETRRPLLRNTLLYFVVPGVAYYLWRTSYFDSLLPNTFYVKSEGRLIHFEAMRGGIYSVVRIAAPFLAVSLRWGTVSRQTSARLVKLSLPWVIFLTAFVLINDEQNVLNRFQIPALPFIIVTFACAWTLLLGESGEVPRSASDEPAARQRSGPSYKVATVAAFIFLALFPAAVQPVRKASLLAGVLSAEEDAGRVTAGRLLAKYAGKNYGLMVTEAGALPFFSGWRTLDAHGLNDSVVAHHGLTRQYVDSFRPDVIMFHVQSAVYREDQPWVLGWPEWERMTKWVYRYATARRYSLVAVCQWAPGVDEFDWYFVRPGCPDSDEIARGLSNMPGVFYARRGGIP